MSNTTQHAPSATEPVESQALDAPPNGEHGDVEALQAFGEIQAQLQRLGNPPIRAPEEPLPAPGVPLPLPMEENLDFDKLVIGSETYQPVLATTLSEIPITKPKEGNLIMARSVTEFGPVLLGYRCKRLNSMGSDEELYFAFPEMARIIELKTGKPLVKIVLRMAMTDRQEVFLIPVSIESDGPGAKAGESLRNALAQVERGWGKVYWANGKYVAKNFISMDDNELLGKPSWPKLTQNQVLGLAFRENNRLIKDQNHAIVAELLKLK
jgi:hypothetical protein